MRAAIFSNTGTAAAIRPATGLFAFWLVMSFGMVTGLPQIDSVASIGAASHNSCSPDNTRPQCPLRNLQNIPVFLAEACLGQQSPQPFAALEESLPKELVSTDLNPPGHVPIVS